MSFSFTKNPLWLSIAFKMVCFIIWAQFTSSSPYFTRLLSYHKFYSSHTKLLTDPQIWHILHYGHSPLLCYFLCYFCAIFSNLLTHLANFPSSGKMGFPGGSDNKESVCHAGDLGLIPGSGGSSGERIPLQYHPTHSGILAWRIPWTEEPGGLQSMGLLRVGHSWATNTFIFTFP